jgi:hypothetical protein
MAWRAFAENVGGGIERLRGAKICGETGLPVGSPALAGDTVV